MSRQKQENKNRADKLLRYFDAHGYPPQYPWALEFLCKVKLNNGEVNTANQQHSIDTLWSLHPCMR